MSAIELGCLLGSCELLTTCKEGKKIKTKWINGNKISENRVSLYYISEDKQQHQLIYIAGEKNIKTLLTNLQTKNILKKKQITKQ